MFNHFYQFCAVIFLLQGISLPFLVLFSGILWLKQNQKLENLKKRLDQDRGKKSTNGELPELILNALPKLKPLNCLACGAGVLLQKSGTFCPNCRAASELPADYAATEALRAQVKSLLKTAVRGWRTANFLIHPLTRWIFFLLVFIEPLIIFPTVVIGSNAFPDTWLDRLLESAGETMALLIFVGAFFGFVIWMTIFILIVNLNRSLGKNLPLIPVFGDSTKYRETANCQACGGGIEYDADDFACLCSYCHAENFRVQFVRRRRAAVEKQLTHTKSVLFGAMEIIEEFIGTFFVISVVLVGAAALLALFTTIKDLL